VEQELAANEGDRVFQVVVLAGGDDVQAERSILLERIAEVELQQSGTVIRGSC
jgi:hypothetical protein